MDSITGKLARVYKCITEFMESIKKGYEKFNFQNNKYFIYFCKLLLAEVKIS